MSHFHTKGISFFRDDVAFEALDRVESVRQLALLRRLHLHFYAEVVQLRQRPLLDDTRTILALVEVGLRGDLLRDQEEAATLAIRVATAHNGTADIFVIVARIR